MNRTFQGVASEQELLQILGIKKEALGVLRRNGLPYVRLSKTCRVYIAEDLFNYFENFKENRTE